MAEGKNKGQGIDEIIVEKLKNHQMEIVLSVVVSPEGETTVTFFKDKKKKEEIKNEGEIKEVAKK
jgi:hypothetical protein